jgi:hypothetical protein
MKHNLLNRVLITAAWLMCGIGIWISMTSTAPAQTYKWMTVGSVQNWYSSMGCEQEEGDVKEQQYGFLWPAIYTSHGLVDIQAAKGMWIAVGNWTYPDNTGGPYVVHIGPRVAGFNEMIPIKLELISKFNPAPAVTVDGLLSEGRSADPDKFDATIPSDRMLVNIVNSTAGITMVRKIMQFGQQFNDNYFVYDYTFTNSGNTSKNDTTTIAGSKTLTGVYFYFQYRYAVCADTRYVIGQNPTGWGINTLNDVRGDGTTPASPFFTDPPSVPGGINYGLRAQYSWHAKYPPFTAYDNIGGPIWTPYYDKSDTTGRLGAAAFVGTVTLHADKSATDKNDDSSQPRTTSYEGSDEPNTSNNDATNAAKNASEYAWITKGHREHEADKVTSTGDPAIGTGGGFSSAVGFGPYTLAAGQSIHIAIAEAAAGLSREACIDIGRKYKSGGGGAPGVDITYSNGSTINNITKKKNDWVYTSRDSLFLTFTRAKANYDANYGIPMPPSPPMSFTVKSAGDRIGLSWEKYGTGGPTVTGYQIYRANGRYDSTYRLIYTAVPTEFSYQDVTPVRGLDYYYYVVSVGDPAQNTGPHDPLISPAGALVSNRYAAQTYLPANLKRKPVEGMDSIRVVPNPYKISAGIGLLFDVQDRIQFFNVPGVCTIRIYTELGELVNTINHIDNSGDEHWDMVTTSKQIVVSGLYIAVFEKPNGERAFRKFVIIR